MRVLVTGGAGFIGSHIVDRLLQLGHEVIVVDNLYSGNRANLSTEAKFFEVDILDPRLKEIFRDEKPDGVIHQAAQANAQKSMEQPGFDSMVNIVGTLKVLENCRDYEVGKVIYASSAAVYGMPLSLPIDENHPVRPISNYGVSKHTPEHFLRIFSELYGINYMVLRYANVYGPRQDPRGEGGVVSIFVDRMINKKEVYIYGDGKQTRDFIYVRDVAEANIKALTYTKNDVVNISTGIGTEVTQLLTKLKIFLGRDIEPIYREPRPGDITESCLDNTKAKKLLQWKPEFSLDEGLRETINCVKGK